MEAPLAALWRTWTWLRCVEVVERKEEVYRPTAKACSQNFAAPHAIATNQRQHREMHLALRPHPHLKCKSCPSQFHSRVQHRPQRRAPTSGSQQAKETRSEYDTFSTRRVSPHFLSPLFQPTDAPLQTSQQPRQTATPTRRSTPPPRTGTSPRCVSCSRTPAPRQTQSM